MKSWVIIAFAFALCGCATHRYTQRFPSGVIEARDAERLAQVQRKLDEPAFWRPEGSPFPESTTAYRLTILPSQPFVACITIHRGVSYDSILRTKVYTWSYKQPIRFKKVEIESEGLVFDESRILSESDVDTFDAAFRALNLAAEDWPPGFHNFFTVLDGTSFFIEANEFGSYRLIQINDPTSKPSTKEGKDMLIQVYPDLDVGAIDPFIQKYLELLKWIAQNTQLAILDEYKKISSSVPEEMERKLADPQH